MQSLCAGAKGGGGGGLEAVVNGGRSLYACVREPYGWWVLSFVDARGDER